MAGSRPFPWTSREAYMFRFIFCIDQWLYGTPPVIVCCYVHIVVWSMVDSEAEKKRTSPAPYSAKMVIQKQNSLFIHLKGKEASKKKKTHS